MITDTYIFIHIPRTAGRTILSALNQPFLCDHKAIFDHEKVVGSTGINSRYKFSTIRNPWDRAVSWYAFFASMNPRYANLTFAQWMEFVIKRSSVRFGANGQKFIFDQFSYLKNSRGIVKVDYLMRFENLEADFAAVASHLGIPVPSPFPVIGDTNRSQIIRQALNLPSAPADYHDAFTSQRLIDAVATWDAQAIAQFGYTY